MEIPIAGKISHMLFDCWGKQIYLQEFTDPQTQRVDEFLIFGITPGTTVVMILPVTDDRKVVAIRQFRYGINRVIQYEIPGGMRPNAGKIRKTLRFGNSVKKRDILLVG